MKKISYIVMGLGMLLLSACQPDSFRKVYPNEVPTLTAQLQETEVLMGTDSLTIDVAIHSEKCPLSTLTVQVIVGEAEYAHQIEKVVLRTKDYAYQERLRVAVPFAANMPDNSAVNVRLTAESVEGDKAMQQLGGCVARRPQIATMYMMPPTINYKVLGKGIEMEKTGEYTFAKSGLNLPKTFKCLMATVGTRFGRVDYSKPVFGMVDGEIKLLPPAVIELIQANPDTAMAFAITLEYDQFESLTAVEFDALAFTFNVEGRVVTPVESLNVMTDLEEEPAYISSSSVRKKYLGAKVYFDKDSEVEIIGVNDLSKAYNLDWMEYLGGNKVKFLGDKAMYYVSYDMTNDYLIVEPLYDVTKPDVMYLCGVGMAQPHQNANAATSGWGFDSPEQNFVGRQIAPQIYQFTVYMKNDAEDSSHPGFGAVNFKFFHQHGWGGEENAVDGGYVQDCCAGMTIVSSTEEGNVGNWWATADPFEGVYRITLDMNTATTKYERVR